MELDTLQLAFPVLVNETAAPTILIPSLLLAGRCMLPGLEHFPFAWQFDSKTPFSFNNQYRNVSLKHFNFRLHTEEIKLTLLLVQAHMARISQ